MRDQLAMLDQLNVIGKTSEFARVFGIEFFDVLSRGSQVLTILLLCFLQRTLVVIFVCDVHDYVGRCLFHGAI